MTSARSKISDNNGLCECCNSPVTLFERQETYPVLLGGGIGWGTMWMCAACRALVIERDRGTTPGKGVFTKEQLAQLDALSARRERMPAPHLMERQLMLARHNASVANQQVERLATENGTLKAQLAALEDGAKLKAENIELRQRIADLELEVSIARSGVTQAKADA